ncbi:uncharacterized [Tachysurus ichikawai]
MTEGLQDSQPESLVRITAPLSFWAHRPSVTFRSQPHTYTSIAAPQALLKLEPLNLLRIAAPLSLEDCSLSEELQSLGVREAMLV